MTNTSHASILNGLLPASHGITDFGMLLSTNHLTLATLLQASGYHTAAFIGAVNLESNAFGPELDEGFANTFVKTYILNMAGKRDYNLERFFKALGDSTRLRLLNLMGDQEICVCYFVEIIGAPQPKISRHLAYLRSAGIVDARREGKWMHYRIVMPPHIGATQILKQTLSALKEDKAMQTDSARLSKACCSPSKYSLLDGAPVPTIVQDSCEAC